MSRMELPEQYVKLRTNYKSYMEALDELGKAAGRQGPIDQKTGHLIQMAAAVAIRSEGAVHSHARRALQSGANPEEIRHAVILLTSTIGFPNVSAALSWIDDIIEERQPDGGTLL
ncbi:MAG: carboxymuconolactone decarboxylase family protein [Thermoleophilia bacterium]|nr:carboxymuconolactone decarboxylase family protein [Thermoleophilia bacterium]